MHSKPRIYSLLAAIASFAFGFSAPTAKAQITVAGATNFIGKPAFTVANAYNPSGASKMVVVITGEHQNPGDTTGNISALTFAGNALTKAVERNPVTGHLICADIWYLDSPGAVAGTFAVTTGGNGVNYVFTVFRMTGTAPGHGATAVSADNSKSVSLTTTAANAIVVASHGLGGDGNTGASSAVNATSPAVELTAISHGSNYVGQCVSTTNPVASPGAATYAFTGGSTTGCVTIAAEFYRAEAVAPTITTYNPADGATGVATNANLVATFSETIKKGTGNILVKNLTDATTTTIAVTDAQVTVSGTTMTINPTLDLVGGKSYAVQIAAGAIKDFAGNNHAGIADDTTWNFDTAADTIAPTITTRSPADNAISVAVASNLVATFGENIAIGTGTILIKNLTDATTTTITLPDAQVTVSGAVLTINPTANLVANKAYAIQIAAGAVTDLAAVPNNFAGIADDTTWNFTSLDNILPTIATLNPADNAAAVAVASNLVATFSENIVIGTGNILVKNLTDATTTTITLPDAQVTVSGAVLTINPTANLLANKNYAIQIAATAIDDTAGNGFAGITNDTTWNFATVDTLAPTITTFNPADGATNVALASNLVATFSENIAKGTGNITIKNLTDATSSAIAVGDAQFTVSGTTLTFNPTSDLLANKNYAIQIAAGAIKDTAPAANNFAGILNDTTWSFASLDTIAPTLAASSIVDDMSGGSVSTHTLVTYTVTFSEDMDASTVTAADFGNAGTSTVTIGTVTETSPGVFSVEATPTTSGTLILQVNAAAALNDVGGNALDTTLAIPDDTTIQVNTLAWDIDGATPGAGGGGSPIGTWATSGTTWSTDSAGSVATSAYTTLGTDDLTFSAGTDAISGYAITLWANQNARSLTFEDGSATISANTLTLAGGGGIAVLAGAGDPIISSGLTLNGGNSSNVGAGRILTLDTGAFTRGTRAALNVVLGAGSTLTSTQTGLAVGDLVNGIVGPWASIGTGATTRYATFTGNNITALTGTAAATAANVTSTLGTLNYDLAAAGTLGASASVNTLRFTGPTGGTLTSSTLFTTNGIMLTGASNLTLLGGTGWTSGASGNELVIHVVDANSELRMTGATAAITGSINKTGAGVFDMRSGADHSIGGITVNQGTLITNRLTEGLPSATINSGGTLKWGGGNKHSNGAVFTINAGGTLDIQGNNDTIGAIAGAGSVTGSSGGFLQSSATGNFSGVMSGPIGLRTSNSTSLQTLSGANTFTGATQVNEGSLILSNVSALGVTPGTNGTSGITIDAAGILRVDITGFSVAAPITLTGAGTATIAAGTTTAVQATFSGGIGGTTTTLAFTSLSNTSNPNHVITLGATSNYTGDTTITVGNNNNNLRVKAGGLNSLSPTTVLTLNGGGGSNTAAGREVAYDLNGNNQTLAGLTNNVAALATARYQRVTNSGALATLTINNSVPFTFGGFNAANSGHEAQITGAIDLVKDGASTFTLVYSQPYTGSTTLTEGTLALGSTNVLPNGAVSIGAATLDAATFTDSTGTLDVTGAATINLGSGGALAFANSSAIDWTGGSLNITGTFVSGSSIRFGTTSGGLISGQLAVISVNGSGAGTYTLDADGYLSLVPTISGVTASQNTTYGATVTLSGTVSASGPVYPANGGTVSVTINGVTQNATIAGGLGGFSVNFNTGTIPASITPYTITYAYAGNGTTLSAAVNHTSTALTIDKAPLSITATSHTKGLGQTVVFSSGSTAFTSSGLMNGETIGSVTLACAGGVSGAALGPYSITPSAATDGSFNLLNYEPTYNDGTLTVVGVAEHAFGTANTGALILNPNGTINTRGQAPIVETTVGSPVVTLTYARLKNSGCTFSAEFSTDLITWLQSTDPNLIYPPGAPAETVTDNGDDMEVVRVKFPIFQKQLDGSYVKMQQNFCQIATTITP